MFRKSHPWRLAISFSLFASSAMLAQSNVSSLSGTVTDVSGAVIPGATITVHNAVSGLTRSATSDAAGHYQFPNLPLNPYHVTIAASGFSTAAQDAVLRSSVPVVITTALQIAAAGTTVTVEGGSDLIENDSTFHTDVDRDLFNKLPLESQSSGVSSLVTLATPGVAADSNGLFHGLGDHASNSFSVDGQPITDQQSKVFSNQIPSNSIQSIEVISGAPPAEYGDKTSLVIEVTTRSGLNNPKPTGSITSSYGTFGSATGGFDLGYGTATTGNFLEIDGLNTGRFLDPPEFKVFHDKGNEQNLFDRVDRQFTPNDSAHLNLNYSRSWFQTPNTYDNLNLGVVDPVAGLPVGATDQHSEIGTYDIAPTYTHIVGTTGIFNFGPYIRHDTYNYYPSHDPFADLGPIQTQTIGQQRTLLNTGIHTDFSYAKGMNNAKAGVLYEHTILHENDSLGIVSTTYNAPCLSAAGAPVAGFTDPSQCAAAGDQPNPGFFPALVPYDLTRGGGLYTFHGHTDVKEIGLYVEDQIKTGNWLFNLGIRGDLYNGLTVARQAEPRLGTAYTIPKTSTVLRASYARTLETPFNENLVLSSTGCTNAVLSPLLLCSPGVSGTLAPGFRNEFHAGLQQAFGGHIVISGDYIWKYTHNAFDFSVLGNTPITFPIDWHNSKIPGFALRADLTTYHGVSAFVTMSSVAARFFPPQVAGAGATVGQSGLPFRIDHDERFNQTTHVSYQLPGHLSTGLFHSHVPIQSPWISFNWRFDSGLTAGSTPCYPNLNDPNSTCAGTAVLLNGQPAVDVSNFTADQQFEAGLACSGIRATPTTPIPSPCLASQLTSTLLKIPAPGTENNDRNTPRIASRDLFDGSIGQDNLFAGDRYKWSLRLTGVNLANKYALYNFLSTFSGTHYVTPRALTAELGFHF
jgi:hypothetical protein